MEKPTRQQPGSKPSTIPKQIEMPLGPPPRPIKQVPIELLDLAAVDAPAAEQVRALAAVARDYQFVDLDGLDIEPEVLTLAASRSLGAHREEHVP